MIMASLLEKVVDDMGAHRANLLRRQGRAERRHVVAAIRHGSDHRHEIRGGVERRAAAVPAFAVGAMTRHTGLLEQLCAGVRPAEVARHKGVAMSTVRTQIGSIRSKTGSGSIAELVRLVAVLPPMVSALRGGVFAGAR